MRPYVLLALLGLSCGKGPPPPAYWKPGTFSRQPAAPNARGYMEVRGLIHAHSIYSHDACDGAPVDEAGVYNQPCLEDFRRDLCAVRHDFVFLTDHRESFTSNEFPDVLLYDSSKGDSLVDHGAGPSANRLACPDGAQALIMAGTEAATMPVGLERHVAERPTRGEIYGELSNSSLDAYKGIFGVNLVAHTEGWSVDQLATLRLDGFEMFNLHRNAFKNAGLLVDLVLNHVEKGKFDTLPHPDLLLALMDMDDADYLATWGSTLARGVQRVTTMGSDCHQNSFPQLLPDGERIDSYRRMMAAISNHLLIRTDPDGTWNDRHLKEALLAGRNYGVFEFVGYAEGFDFVALEGGVPKEIGSTVSLAQGVVLKVQLPKVAELDPAGPQPTLTIKLWKARDGGWDEVASGSSESLEYTVTSPGAYRTEVRMVPGHLAPWIGPRTSALKTERPWIYSSALYVEP